MRITQQLMLIYNTNVYKNNTNTVINMVKYVGAKTLTQGQRLLLKQYQTTQDINMLICLLKVSESFIKFLL